MELLLSRKEKIVAIFSCITALEQSKKSKKRKKDKQQSHASEDESAEDTEESEIHPGISFWIAFDWPECIVEHFEDQIARDFLNLGVDVDSCKTITGRGSSNISTLEAYSASLFVTLKDHKCAEAISLARASEEVAIQEAANAQGYEVANVLRPSSGSNKPAQLTLTPRLCHTVAKEVLEGLEKMKFTALNINLNNMVVETDTPSQNVQSKPRSKILQAVDLIKRIMEENNYGLYEGSIYKKIDEALYTYVYCYSVEDFLHHLMKNVEIADVIILHANQLTSFLRKPACKLIQPIKIDYNYIEVNDGYCFNIEEKKFEKEPPKLKGSPRAYVRYRYTPGRVPYPKPFIEGVENSFPENKKRMYFYQKYYQILMHGKFPIKEPKLVLVGAADSGKTSWFYPFQGIIPSDYIASVMRDGRFSGHMINQQSQVVFMDEWTSDSLCCEDAKRILQGGRLSLAQKHQSASTCNYNSGFFITTNLFPDFGNERDCDAIRRRLAIFDTETLPNKDTNVSAWLRLHCMQIFHYVADQLKNTPIFECSNKATIYGEGEENMGAVFNDFDKNHLDFLENEKDFSFSYSQSINHAETGLDETPLVDQEMVDSAILQADESENILYEDLAFEHDLVDYVSEPKDRDYLRKVYEIITGEWIQIKPHVTERITEIYQMKLRRDWNGADSAYDAWLLLRDCRRTWFPYDFFDQIFPDWEEASEWVKEKEHEYAEISSPAQDSDTDSSLPTFKRNTRFRSLSSSGSSSSSSSSSYSDSAKSEAAKKPENPLVLLSKQSLLEQNPLVTLSSMSDSSTIVNPLKKLSEEIPFGEFPSFSLDDQLNNPFLEFTDSNEVLFLATQDDENVDNKCFIKKIHPLNPTIDPNVIVISDDE